MFFSFTAYCLLPLTLFFSPIFLSADQGLTEEEIMEATAAEPVSTIENEADNKADIAKISEAFGHLIGKNIESLGLEFDIDKVVKGLKDSSSGKNSPMSEMECVEAISSIQEKHFKEQAALNLAVADQFLKENASKEGIVSIEEGKLQYKVDAEGQGDAIEESCNPLIRYTGKYVDGTVFGSSQKEEILPMDETIAGISKGLIGMKEGEKRTLYIHPDLGYGTNGILAPNSLLTFEVELIKAHAPFSEEEGVLSKSSQQKSDRSEIATPMEEAPAIR
jgi:peptidylprolyl isomerase